MAADELPMERRTRVETPGNSGKRQEGLDPSRLYQGDFVLVRMALVDEVGFDAAIVMQRICWRCELRPTGWRATLGQIAAETRLSRARVQAATQLLRRRGYLRAQREASWSSTLTWQPIFHAGDAVLKEGCAAVDPGSAETGLPEQLRTSSPPIDDLDDITTTRARTAYLDPNLLNAMFRMPRGGDRP
jgi:hypothetical protein